METTLGETLRKHDFDNDFYNTRIIIIIIIRYYYNPYLVRLDSSTKCTRCAHAVNVFLRWYNVSRALTVWVNELLAGGGEAE